MHSESSSPKRRPTRKCLRAKGRCEVASEDSDWRQIRSVTSAEAALAQTPSSAAAFDSRNRLFATGSVSCDPPSLAGNLSRRLGQPRHSRERPAYRVWGFPHAAPWRGGRRRFSQEDAFV